MAAPKRSATEREAHLRVMEKSLLEGVPSAEIVAAVAKKYQISERQAFYDLAEIHKRWEAAGKEIAGHKHAQCSLMRALLRREYIYRLALQQGDLKNALAAESDRCVLAGLYPAKRTEVTGPAGGPIQFTELTDAELEAIVRADASGDRTPAPPAGA
jgi:hypothetical protein